MKTAKELIKERYPQNGGSIVAARVDGKIIDLSTELPEDVEVEPIRSDSSEGLEILRHSTSHVMAQAVKHLFPDVKVTIGPAIENGFYYDFDSPTPFTPEDLPKIEEEMKSIIKEDLPFERMEMSREDAIEFFKKNGESYKVELIQDISDDKVSLYKQGDFVDLCRGPHIPSTSYIKAFKLTHVAGAYWRGDENNPMLQRIYGTAFPTKKDLKQYLSRIEEAKKRDHRKLGRELDLFILSDEWGPGMPIWLPKGALLRSILEEFERKEHLRRGYEFIVGPQLLRLEMWQRSGHFEHYRDFMYFTEIEGQKYGLKPMNCVAHMMAYRSKKRSYRELPKRYFELGTVHRHEKSGVLHGLLRVRQFTQDDAHIICRPDQLNDEIQGVIEFVKDMMKVFGFPFEIEISTRPEKYIGSDEMWEEATSALMGALDQMGLPYDINEGDGAFYGPKIDIKLKDALERRWQCATIQCDFALPERFNLTYIGKDGEPHRPVMIHRVILGALERFIGILIEHYGGAFPVWLAPTQSIVLTVTDRCNEYAREVYKDLKVKDIRVEADLRNEKLGLKIREAQLKKIPYMLIIGDREVESQKVTPRMRDGKNLPSMSVEEFIEHIQAESDPWKGIRE